MPRRSQQLDSGREKDARQHPNRRKLPSESAPATLLLRGSSSNSRDIRPGNWPFSSCDLRGGFLWILSVKQFSNTSISGAVPRKGKCDLRAVRVGVLLGGGGVYGSRFPFTFPGSGALSTWRVGVQGRRCEMSTMFADTLLIVFISVCTALLAEGITWVLVYRTDKYKRLKAEVEKQSKKLEKKKETITESAGRQQKKKIERQEEKLKNNNRDLSMVRMKSMFAIGFCFTALMGMFNSIFDGRVVAKLPFTPLSYIQGLSHRNLLGDDTTDCSFIFLYILCTMSIRQNIQKILGLAPSRAATKQAGGFLGPPPPSGKFS
uniref:Calcium load-activated calcium channel n=1 Tax=Aotus nancymaae TaxID=37293 RepID=A0A2K5CGV9_AOTNA|nr:calcium load-activated calcium channel isoform X2 [Aotus nancymaae]